MRAVGSHSLSNSTILKELNDNQRKTANRHHLHIKTTPLTSSNTLLCSTLLPQEWRISPSPRTNHKRTDYHNHRIPDHEKQGPFDIRASHADPWGIPLLSHDAVDGRLLHLSVVVVVVDQQCNTISRSRGISKLCSHGLLLSVLLPPTEKKRE